MSVTSPRPPQDAPAGAGVTRLEAAKARRRHAREVREPEPPTTPTVDGRRLALR